MRLLVLNGNPEGGATGFDAWCESFAASARSRSGNDARVIALRELDIRFCTGCWSCWWATPGRCAHKDGMEAIYRLMLGSDVLVWASPLVMGNVSALVKKAQDRFIPLVHPYIELANGESHHKRRYPKDMDMGLVIQAEPEDGPEDIALVRHQAERLALNGRGRLKLFATTATDPEEAANEALSA